MSALEIFLILALQGNCELECELELATAELNESQQKHNYLD